MNQLAEHDLTTAVTGIGRGDEIGEMASAVQVVKDNMIAADCQAAECVAEQVAKERGTPLDLLVRNFEGKAAGFLQTLASACDDVRDLNARARAVRQAAGEIGDQRKWKRPRGPCQPRPRAPVSKPPR